LGDILTYRIPNKEIVRLKGKFLELQEFTGIEGFIVSSFNKEKKYHFIENDFSESFSFSQEEPHCYTQNEYTKIAAIFLKSLKTQNLSKAIFSRVKQVGLESEPFDLFNQLCITYPDAFVYLMSSPFFGTWLGASPEVLIHSNGNNAETMSLAGTLKIDSNEVWKNKEFEEQNHVTTYIESLLQVSKVENLVISGQQEFNAGPVRHLSTTFQFDLGTNSAIEIAEKLHPTPAVSGFPKNEAIELIGNIEQHDRKIYAGMIGFIDTNSTHLYVNLRCAEIIDNRAYLYLGGGFTKDSLVLDEWNETENKAKTLLNVMKKQ